MSVAHCAPTPAAAIAARSGDATALADALTDSRRDTLQTFAAFEAGLPHLRVPQREELNPPLWELGHIGWFQSHWTTRNPDRHHGWRADPLAARVPPARRDADALYDSSRVSHASRWSLPLPDANATRLDLHEQLAGTLQCLASLADSSPEALYFFRLVLLHEGMHHEAALYMAQGLGVRIADPRWQCPVLPDPVAELALDPEKWCSGGAMDAGFAFDNECGQQAFNLPASSIDAQVLRWQEFLPFVQSRGYEDPRWWTPAGWQWREQMNRCGALAAPRYLRPAGGAGDSGTPWEQWRHGLWRTLDPREPACHLTLHEAQAWCRWAGRRLPTEAEWERAAHRAGPAFRWGDVWEWTATAFAPFPGFEPHPYRDYSAPWFDGRPVLKGASFMTQARMRHPRYRNFFTPERTDVPAGFRTCAL